MSKEIRLNKYIRDSGFCSRREADRYIQAGSVRVNNKKADLGTMVRPGDQVYVNNHYIEPEEQMIYLAFNKPMGITCTTDQSDPTNIIDYIRYPKRIFTVGRIDKDSEGLILLTNDGDIVNRILRVENEHSKEYVVTVNKRINDDFIEKMTSGVPIHNTVTLPAEVEQLSENSFSIVLIQGLNRQIRLMCEALGYEVVHLERVRVMNITTKGIGLGNYRELSSKEIEDLLEATKDSVKTDKRSKKKKSRPQSRSNPSVRHAQNKKWNSKNQGKKSSRGKSNKKRNNRGKKR